MTVYFYQIIIIYGCLGKGFNVFSSKGLIMKRSRIRLFKFLSSFDALPEFEKLHKKYCGVIFNKKAIS